MGNPIRLIVILTVLWTVNLVWASESQAQSTRKRGRTAKATTTAPRDETPKSEPSTGETPAPKDGDTPKQDASSDPAAPESKEKASESEKAPTKPKIETATLGAGCFWSVEAVFERVKGVKSVVSGFSGGTVEFPSYQLVCTGNTGHAEVIQVVFDPSVLSYEALLKLYFQAHDPTTLNAQGDDFGTQYRSVIFHHSEEQKQTALKVYRELTARRAFRAPIVTQLVKFSAFYPAEAYHQDYYRHNPLSDYSLQYIIPKLRKMAKVKIQDTKPRDHDVKAKDPVTKTTDQGSR